jgi:excisionase family DNA binding protein
MARRCKLTDELQQKIVDLINDGHYFETVCQSVSLAPSTFYRWLATGREEAAEREAAIEQEPVWITTKEAAALTDLPVTKIRRAARDGAFEAEKRGRLWYLNRAEVLEWAEPQGSKFLEFYEAVTSAKARAEISFVDLWRKQLPEDWRSVAAFLSRRYPERWGERRQIDARVQAGVEMSGKLEHEHEIEFPQDAVTSALERFRGFLKQEAVEWEEMGMAIKTFLSDGEARSLEEVAEAIDKNQGRVLKCLQDLTGFGQVKKVEGGKWALTWKPGADDDVQDEETLPPEPPPDVTLEPQGPPPHQAPILRHKRTIAALQDGDVEKIPFM